MARVPVYATDWLNERFPFDVAARNPVVEQACLAAMDQHTELQLVDIGAGNGANPRYFMDRIPQDQYWTLIELDPQLGKASLEELLAHGKKKGYEGSMVSETTIVLSNIDKTITIRSFCGSLLELDKHINLGQVNCVMANAVFDLFSENQFIAFCDKLLDQRIPFLSTLNYTGMSFAPEEAEDETIVAWYESHMQRLQPFGRAMGADGPELMERWLGVQKGQLYAEESTWKIKEEDRNMLGFLLGFMEEAIPELSLNPEQLTYFDNWLQRKRQHSANHQLQISVKHKDILFLPNN